MKKLIYIFIALIIPISLSSQLVDSTSEVRIMNAIDISVDTIKFQLELVRQDLLWDGFANSTFHIKFDDTLDLVSPSKYGIVHLESEIKKGNMSESFVREKYYDSLSQLRYMNGYRFNVKTLNDKFYISILGPSEYAQVQQVTYLTDTTKPLILGSFLLYCKSVNNIVSSFPRGKDPEEGVRLVFNQPVEKYQACAFKVNNQQIEELYSDDDNVNISEPILQREVNYKNDATPKIGLNLHGMQTKYIGGLKIGIYWKTKSEKHTVGWRLERGIKPFYGSFDDIEYDRVVGDFNIQSDQPKNLKGQRTTLEPTNYSHFDDENIQRGLTYCYRLYTKDTNNTITYRDFACATVTNSLITAVNALPNPFETSTKIEYALDDNARVTIKVYNISGGEVVSLMEDKEHIKQDQPYIIDLNMPQFASNGLYDLIITAIPTTESYIEKSTAVLKLHMVR